MKMKYILITPGLLPAALLVAVATASAQDPLPSWKDTVVKKAIIEFVKKVTKDGSPDFVKKSVKENRSF
jgi:hypothetical protein